MKHQAANLENQGQSIKDEARNHRKNGRVSTYQAMQGNLTFRRKGNRKRI